MGKKKKPRRRKSCLLPGYVAKTSKGEKTLHSFQVGGLPLIDHILRRMRLPDLLRHGLPDDDPRVELPTYRGLSVLVCNILISRDPIYGVGQWAATFAPDLLGLRREQIELLNDDRIGRCLDCLFDSLHANLIMSVVRQVIQEFQLSLEELHNDSTTVSFYGAYDDAERERQVRGRPTLAITYGHSKDHRPDLKQLLYILTVTEDGGVPIYFTSASGNTADDTTHRQTWDLLRELVGRSDFLYVADCKLASTENMNYIAREHGCFITVLPRTRKEDRQFRERLLKHPDAVSWTELYTQTENRVCKGVVLPELIDRMSVCSENMLSEEGYRLLWYHSTRKAEQDAQRRTHRLQRALRELAQLRERLHGPKTRLTERKKVQQAVDQILTNCDVDSLLTLEIVEREKASYRQARRGRPGKNTKYLKDVQKRFDISWTLDPVRLAEQEACDGIFPLISNVKEMTPEQILRAYKRQPLIEKRFSHFKTDFSVAPVYLKSTPRIQALLGVYFFVLIVQTLLERELRQAMQRQKVKSLPLYAEERDCRRPTTRKLLDLFEGVQRHELRIPGEETEVMVTELSPVQKQILNLLGISPRSYGRLSD